MAELGPPSPPAAPMESAVINSYVLTFLRTPILGPSIINWDLSAIKNFQLGETRQLQFRLETFKLPNHPNSVFTANSANSGTSLTDPNFGKIRNTRTDMQVGLKFIF